METDRLILRCLDPNEVDGRYVGWLNDPVVNRYLEVRLAPQTLESVRGFVADINASDHSLMLGMFVKAAAGQHIGNIKIGPVNRHHKRGDIGLVIGERSQWGKGYAAEAIGRFTDYGHQEMGLVRITAGVYEKNVGSQKAFLKCGYEQEALLKNFWESDGEEREGEFIFAHFKEAKR